jgi:hypothetical protein
MRKLIRVDLLIIDDFALHALDALDTADVVYDYDEPVTMPRGGHRGWSRAGGMGLLSA